MTRFNNPFMVLAGLPDSDPVRATIAALAKPPLDDSEKARCERRRVREAAAEQRATIAEEMVRVVAAGIRQLNTELYGNCRIPETLVLERSRNITTGILGNWDVRSWP